MKIAYADPPYLGQARHYRDHPESERWNDPQSHVDLIHRLVTEFPDGWALSLSVPSLRVLLPACPENVRVFAWVKPFAAFKKNVNPSSAWEPVLVCGGRKRSDVMTYMRDWCAEPITLKRGLTGAKPERFCYWLFDAMNLRPTDELVDLFPGTGIVGQAWKKYRDEFPAHASWINRVKSGWELGKGLNR